MNRKYVALAAAAALAAPAFASANPSVYGRAHLSVDLLDNGADSGLNVSSNSSRLGFKGEHELDYGLTAIYQIESEVRFDTQGADVASRDTFGGIQGDFGMLRLGKFDTPFKVLRGRVDLFGDQVGDARNITRGTVRFDERFENSIHYRTPSFGGLFADVHYATTRSGSDTADNDDDAISVALTYREGPLYAAIAYELNNNVNVAGDGQPAQLEDLGAVRLAASYQLGDLRLTALAQQADVNADRSDNVYGFGARYGMGNTGIRGQVYLLDADVANADATMIAVGVDHRLARNFTVYANYAMVDNDNAAALVPYNQARTTGSLSPQAGETTSGLSVGMIYNF